jgi:hydroxymethylpyrimidine pyrophosphatase-like HAD family hydrolase/hypoxanthine phosphoribosyltransferase
VRDFTGLGEFLRAQLEDGHILDAFLTAAGMNQIIEDHLHRDLGELKKSARHLRAVVPGAARLGAVTIERLGASLQRLYPTIREADLIEWQPEVALLVQDLAAAVAGVPSVDGPALRTKGVADRVGRAPALLRRSLIRLPACFTTFDQQPGDIARLAHDFSERWPDRRRPLVVVGVRTSGSYLAPLMAAFLKAQAFSKVQVVTWRAEQEWLPTEHRRLVSAIRSGALALAVDDPPTSGRTLAGAAAALKHIGFPRASIVLAFASFPVPAWGSWPQRLADYESVILPWDQWEIHRQLATRAVQRSLTRLLAGGDADVFMLGRLTSFAVAAVGEVERIPFPATFGNRVQTTARGHVRALYRVQLIERGTGRMVDQEVYCRGTGLGYLGAASASIAGRLPDYLPPVYGARGGLMYRAWLPEASRLDVTRADPCEVVARIASYAASRAQALRVAEELSSRLVTNGAPWGETIWQDVAQLLSPAFGRAAPIARALLRAAFLRLLPVSGPCIIDGRTDAGQWFEVGDSRARSLRKTGFAEGAYRAGTIRCYDPWFDVASAAVGQGGRLGASLRAAYSANSGESVDEERWLLYRLLALEDRRDSRARSPEGLIDALGPLTREMSSLLNHYLGDLYLGDVPAAANGPLCAIDVDGVLETPWLSFASMTPAGGQAMRCLAAHGYRAVLATGRSVDEVRDRCEAYRLAGGVAEYGAAIYNHGTGAVRPLISAADQAHLDELRRVLGTMDEVHVDPAYRHVVRAYRIQSGRRCRLDQETVERALAPIAARPRLQSIVGGAQTDFVTVGLNKGTGLRALARDLEPSGIGGDRAVAMAVGDASSDLPMFEVADRSFAPANVDETVRRWASQRRARITNRSHQSGLLEAVSFLVGHRPDGCPRCRPPELSAEAGRLIALLTAQDLGRWRKLAHLVRLRFLPRLGLIPTP